jgi:hypothetical protein
MDLYFQSGHPFFISDFYQNRIGVILSIGDIVVLDKGIMELIIKMLIILSLEKPEMHVTRISGKFVTEPKHGLFSKGKRA